MYTRTWLAARQGFPAASLVLRHTSAKLEKPFMSRLVGLALVFSIDRQNRRGLSNSDERMRNRERRGDIIKELLKSWAYKVYRTYRYEKLLSVLSRSR